MERLVIVVPANRYEQAAKAVDKMAESKCEANVYHSKLVEITFAAGGRLLTPDEVVDELILGNIRLDDKFIGVCSEIMSWYVQFPIRIGVKQDTFESVIYAPSADQAFMLARQRCIDHYGENVSIPTAAGLGVTITPHKFSGKDLEQCLDEVDELGDPG